MAGKSKRTSKTSHGVHGGGGKTTLSELQKVLLGKGRLDALAHRAAAERSRKK